MRSLVRVLVLSILTMFSVLEVRLDFFLAHFFESTIACMLKMLESGARDVQMVT